MRALPRMVDVTVAVLAIAALVAGSIIIGVQRASYDRHYYISELGAQGLPTEQGFKVGFTLVCVGIALVAWVVRSLRARAGARARGLALWPPALTLLAASLCFGVASQVNCSDGCPALLSEGSQPRDLVHIGFAIAGFVVGCWAMLQIAAAKDAWLRRASVTAGVLVGAIAAVGGLLSLAQSNTDLGSTLEFVAAGMGVAWLIGVTLVHVLHRGAVREARRAPAPFEASADASS